MIGAILQARLQSTRLPMKVLKRIGCQTIIEHCIQRMLQMAVDRRIVVTNQQSYGILSRYTMPYDVELVVGPDDDVLSRFSRAARAYHLKTIVRLTADNPFVSDEYVNIALRAFAAEHCDYFHYVDLPLGAGVEIFTAMALFAAHNRATMPYEREHVTPYIYRNSDRFAVVHATRLTHDHSGMLMTIDTEADYQRMVRLFANCNTSHPSLRKIIAAYQTRNE